MKRFRILHRTCYNFSVPVTLGEHALRLRPRESHELAVEAFTLDIRPLATLRWSRDAMDNSVAAATFSEPTQQLTIASEVVVQQRALRPFDFVLASHSEVWPFRYSEAESAMLSPYLKCSAGGRPSGHFSHWLDDGARSLPKDIGAFARLQQLNSQVHRSLSYRTRYEEGVQTPEATLVNLSGACRDFAALFVEAARHLGFAARFVSGYLHTAALNDNFGATHAWAEVYLPGAGWKAFDPTLAQLVGADHFPVAVAHAADAVPPVSGSFSGSASATLDVGVWVIELQQIQGMSTPDTGTALLR